MNTYLIKVYVAHVISKFTAGVKFYEIWVGVLWGLERRTEIPKLRNIFEFDSNDKFNLDSAKIKLWGGNNFVVGIFGTDD